MPPMIKMPRHLCLHPYTLEDDDGLHETQPTLRKLVTDAEPIAVVGRMAGTGPKGPLLSFHILVVFLLLVSAASIPMLFRVVISLYVS